MSTVVFVGNIPYNVGEDQLIDIFKSVGQVVGFRLLFDRDTGKPRGYGFCEFSDHQAAASAARNLNDTLLSGRPLRVSLAESDPLFEGLTTVRGEVLGMPNPRPAAPHPPRTAAHDSEVSMANLPPGRYLPKAMLATDAIRATLNDMAPSQLFKVLAQMKAFIITEPERARTLLQKQPQLSYALIQGLLLHDIFPAEVRYKLRVDVIRTASPMHTPPSSSYMHPPSPHEYPRPHRLLSYPQYLTHPPPLRPTSMHTRLPPRMSVASDYYHRHRAPSPAMPSGISPAHAPDGRDEPRI